MESMGNGFLSEALSTSWIASLAICAFFGLLLVFSENRVRPYLKWLVIVSVFLPLLSEILVMVNWFQVADRPILGWIWPREELGSIHVGYGIDLFTYGITVSLGLAVILRSVLYPLSRLIAPALLFGVTGTFLCWSAKTYGLAMIGLVLAILAGGMAMIGSYQDADDDHWIAQYLKRNVIGLLVAFIGSFGLLSLGCTLDFTDASMEAWSRQAGEISLQVSIAMVLVGLFLVVTPFTTQSSLAKKNRLHVVDFCLFLTIFPAISALAIFQKFYSHLLLTTGALQIQGVVSSVLLLLLLIPLFFKSKAIDVFKHYCTLFPLVSLIALSFSGVWPFYVLTLSFVVFSLVCAFLISSPKSGWATALFFFAVYGWMGGFGFAAASGYLQLFQHPEEFLPFLIPAALGILLMQVKAWKIFLDYQKASETGASPWWKLLSLQVLLFIPLGILYTGTYSGGALPSGMDLVPGLNEIPWVKFYVEKIPKTDEQVFIISSSVHWAVFVLSLLIAVFTQGKSNEESEGISARFPTIRKWVDSGLGFDRIHDYFVGQFESAGFHLKETISKNVWEKALPAVFGGFFSTMRAFGSRIDRISAAFSSEKLKILIDAPSKLVQLSQNGDLQWYIFFGIVWTLVLLVHFIRF